MVCAKQFVHGTEELWPLHHKKLVPARKSSLLGLLRHLSMQHVLRSICLELVPARNDRLHQYLDIEMLYHIFNDSILHGFHIIVAFVNVKFNAGDAVICPKND